MESVFPYDGLVLMYTPGVYIRYTYRFTLRQVDKAPARR